MKFSVLLSLYHKESPNYLRESLDSVFHQTLPPDEVVMVEDGPLTPELYDVVRQFASKHPEMKVITLEKNVGLGKALNEGLRHCSHELVARMDTDDICKPERFARQVSYMEKHPETAVVGTWIDEFQGDKNNVLTTRKLPESHEKIYAFGKKRNPMNHPVVMFRKSMVEAMGSYQPMPLFEDYYLWVRMLLGGCKFHNLQEPLLYFRFSPDMFKRRGGIKYAWVEMCLQWMFFRIGYIGIGRMCSNIAIRSLTRIVPNSVRGIIYKNLLRK